MSLRMSRRLTRHIRCCMRPMSSQRHMSPLPQSKRLKSVRSLSTKIFGAIWTDTRRTSCNEYTVYPQDVNAPEGHSHDCVTKAVVNGRESLLAKLADVRGGYSRIIPSVEMVTTCKGIHLPLACSACLTACSMPPQQGTSMRTIVTLWMLLPAMICVSLSE